MNVKKANAKIVKAGPRSTVQDKGRLGFKHFGVGQSGAADIHAYSWANRLLGNDPNASSIECLMGGLCLRFESTTQICVTGANTKIRINDRSVSNWTSLDVQSGDILQLGVPSIGLYNYVAIKNGFSIDPILGSSSSALRDKLGPFDGKALESGQTLEYVPQTRRLNEFNRSCNWQQIPDYSKTLNLRFIPSNQYQNFSTSGIQQFLSGEYAIAPSSDKMGSRLSGPELHYVGENLMSQAVCLGTIQIPPSGKPIILLADHQTIGGYPKLGCVYTSDCYLLAQRRPGQKVRFSKGSLEAAQKDLEHFINLFF